MTIPKTIQQAAQAIGATVSPRPARTNHYRSFDLAIDGYVVATFVHQRDKLRKWMLGLYGSAKNDCYYFRLTDFNINDLHPITDNQ